MSIRSLRRLVLAATLFSTGLMFPSSFAATSSTPAVTRLVLVKTSTQKDLRALTSPSVINLATDSSTLNVRAEVSGTVGSVAFYYNGRLVRTENVAPFAFMADDAGRYRAWTPNTGTHKLRAIAYSSINGKGTPSAPLEITLNVVNSTSSNTAPAPAPVPDATPTPTPTPASAVTRLMLINTATQKEIRALAPGDTIDLNQVGAALNIRADVSGKTGSVAFYYDGKLFSTENVAPHAFAADDSGKFRSWAPTTGSHKIRAIPFSSSNRGGTAGSALEIAFNVVAGRTEPTPTTPTTPPAEDPVVIEKPSESSPTPIASALYDAAGNLNVDLYNQLAHDYSKSAMEFRFGPAFDDLSPNAPDDRPTNFRPASITRSSGYVRTNPYELGTNPSTDGDYWSESGQVAYVPQVLTDPGLDRVQVYAYYDKVFAISPRLDWASGKPHPDLQTREPYYQTFFGELPKHPVAMARNQGQQTNEALVLYKGGKLAVAGTQTSRPLNERPYPGFKFPANKVPTGIAMTTSNEFACITIWDTETRKGQLAILALEGKFLKFHTWPYMAMPNQGSWSGFKLLGYVDLPMAMPSSVAAASNGWWSGPSQTGGLVLSQIDLANESHRKNVYSGGWVGVVARGGYAIVASKFDNKVAIVDLAPLFQYVRESYLSSADSFKKTIAARGAGPANFPEAFSVKPEITPKVVWQSDISKPNAVLAGFRLDRWTKDYYKAYVASEDGTISIIDATPVIQRAAWERRGSLRIAGTFNVGRNPVSMCFTRRGESGLPLLPTSIDGSAPKGDPFNNLIYIAVRGDRKVVAAVTFEGKGAVYRTIKDKRMGDPVAVSTAIRGPILSVTDFRGKKMLSFRVGKIDDLRNKRVYGMGADGKAPFEFTGEVPVAGYPFLINTTNVN